MEIRMSAATNVNTCSVPNNAGHCCLNIVPLRIQRLRGLENLPFPAFVCVPYSVNDMI